MYNQDYEDYMRSVLGYTPNYQDNTYRDLGANNNYYFYNTDFFQQPTNNLRYESMYPDIYKKIQPLVLQEINTNTRNITEDVIDEMVDRVYEKISNMRGDTEIVHEKVVSSSNTKNVKTEEIRENRGDRSNNFLRDLIKIILLKEFIQRPPRPPRPCFGPGNCPGGGPGPRPPFPGGPGMPPPMPRDYYM